MKKKKSLVVTEKQELALTVQNAKHAIAARLILVGKTNRYVAKVCGVSETTISNWWKDQGFLTVLATLQEQTYGSADRQLAYAYVLAVKQTIKDLKSKNPVRREKAIERVFRSHGLYVDTAGKVPRFAGALPGKKLGETEEPPDVLPMTSENIDKMIKMLELSKEVRATRKGSIDAVFEEEKDE